MYSMGVPIGIFVDNRGPRPAVLGGSVCLAIGYFPLHQAYDRASGSVALLCFFSFLSGLGGCMAFSAAVKTSALNWPHHRGTATAFPLAAFGLSAFFFAFLGSLFFPGDPSDFLMLLSSGTSGLTFLGFFFLKVHAETPYHAVSASEQDASLVDSRQLHRTPSDEAKRRDRDAIEPGMSSDASSSSPDAGIVSHLASGLDSVPTSAAEYAESARDETSSLMSSIAAAAEGVVGTSVDLDRSHRIDIRGFTLLRNLEFWQLFSIMAILAGIGLMTIK